MICTVVISIVTGYSQSIDVTVKRSLYLLPRGGSYSFRNCVEFCSKERGNEKTSCTHTIAVPGYRNSACGYTEGRRPSARQGGSTGEAEGCQEGGQDGFGDCRRARRTSPDTSVAAGATHTSQGRARQARPPD